MQVHPPDSPEGIQVGDDEESSSSIQRKVGGIVLRYKVHTATLDDHCIIFRMQVQPPDSPKGIVVVKKDRCTFTVMNDIERLPNAVNNLAHIREWVRIFKI